MNIKQIKAAKNILKKQINIYIGNKILIYLENIFNDIKNIEEKIFDYVNFSKNLYFDVFNEEIEKVTIKKMLSYGNWNNIFQEKKKKLKSKILELGSIEELKEIKNLLLKTLEL